MQAKAFTAVDLFSGAGGLSLGLQWAGFRVVAAVENNPYAVETYRHNIGDHVIDRSIYDVTSDDIVSLGEIEDDLVLLAGGPPCQGFSVQRRGPDHDERNHLVLEFLRMVVDLSPRFFLMENVKGLLSKRGKPYVAKIVDEVTKRGYKIHIETLNAVHYGAPQMRERVFLIGERCTDGVSYYRFPEPVNVEPQSWRTVRDAIGDLPSPPEDGSCHPEYHNHFRERLSAINRERISYVPQGGGREYIPDHLQLACHKRNASHRHLDTYGRLAWDQPSVTLTARFDSFTRGKFAHPEEDRTITLREGARIQTFPDEFEFIGTKVEVAKQIGNAVPPVLARALGVSIIEALQRRERGKGGVMISTPTVDQAALPLI